MTEQQPMTTHDAPNAPHPDPYQAGQSPQRQADAPKPAMTTEEHMAETERLNKQLYDFRKTADPLLYERVLPYHPHANGSDESFATFTADYERAAAEHLPPPEGGEGGAQRRGQPQHQGEHRGQEQHQDHQRQDQRHEPQPHDRR